MNRRELLLTAGAALGVSAFPFGWAAAADKKKQKILYFTRSAASCIPWSMPRKARASPTRCWTELGQKNNFDVVCTKDGAVFDGDLDQ